MRRDLEQYLWNRLPTNAHIRLGLSLQLFTRCDQAWPRDVINEMMGAGLINSAKQAWATLEKWSRKGAYDYGTSLDLGWRTQEEMP